MGIKVVSSVDQSWASKGTTSFIKSSAVETVMMCLNFYSSEAPFLPHSHFHLCLMPWK